MTHDELADRMRNLIETWRTPDPRALIAQLRDALVAIEWKATGLREEGNGRWYWSKCPECADPPERAQLLHKPGCILDAALTACGLDTQEKRDAARAGMRGGT